MWALHIHTILMIEVHVITQFKKKNLLPQAHKLPLNIFRDKKYGFNFSSVTQSL